MSTPLTAAHPRTIRLRPDDNVVIAVDISAGRTAAGLTARERILKGHKMAVEPIGEGEPIHKFGQIIGFATKHDRARRMGARAQCRPARIRARLPLRRGREERRAAAARAARRLRGLSPRPGQTGTRNYIGILTSVNCSPRSRDSRRRGRALGVLAEHPEIDGVGPSYTVPVRARDPRQAFRRAGPDAMGFARHSRSRRRVDRSVSAVKCSRSTDEKQYRLVEGDSSRP